MSDATLKLVVMLRQMHAAGLFWLHLAVVQHNGLHVDVGCCVVRLL
jgi:hypothetical protein